MRAWKIFWTVSLVASGIAFAVITAIVSVRGFGDLREMFRNLRKQGEGAAADSGEK
jgi:hypothetical protein